MPPKNLSASVRQRLYNLAKAGGEGLQILLTRYGVERLLYRISRTPGADRLVLKGAVLFYVWEGAPHRPTRDVDFSASGDPSPEAIGGTFRAICTAEVEPDGLAFLAGSVRVEAIRNRQEYGGVRVTLTALLGTARIPLQIDIGFGDAITPAHGSRRFRRCSTSRPRGFSRIRPRPSSPRSSRRWSRSESQVRV